MARRRVAAMTDAESPPPRGLIAALEAARPALGSFGRDVRYYESAGSTMDVARRLAAQGSGQGVVVLANHQSAGRGRSGRDWWSPPGAGLYASVVIGRAGIPLGPGTITLGAGVALAEAIRATADVPVRLKWPNDLVVEAAAGRRRKLGGILAEGIARHDGLDRVVLGFGVNLQAAPFPGDLDERVTSIAAVAGRGVDRTALLVEILRRLRGVTEALEAGATEAVLVRWRRLSPSCRGAPVAWTTPAGRRTGTTAGVDRDGALLVETSEGRMRIVSTAVRWM